MSAPASTITLKLEGHGTFQCTPADLDQIEASYWEAPTCALLSEFADRTDVQLPVDTPRTAALIMLADITRPVSGFDW